MLEKMGENGERGRRGGEGEERETENSGCACKCSFTTYKQKSSCESPVYYAVRTRTLAQAQV